MVEVLIGNIGSHILNKELALKAPAYSIEKSLMEMKEVASIQCIQYDFLDFDCSPEIEPVTFKY